MTYPNHNNGRLLSGKMGVSRNQARSLFLSTNDSILVGKKTLIASDGKKYSLDNKLNDISGAEWSYFLRSVINTRYQTSGDESYAHKIRKITIHSK